MLRLLTRAGPDTAPGTRGELRLWNACAHPPPSWQGIIPAPCQGDLHTFCPPWTRHRPNWPPPQPLRALSSCSRWRDMPLARVMEQPAPATASHKEQAVTAPLTPTWKKTEEKHSHLVRKYVQSKAAEHAAIALNIVNYVILLQISTCAHGTPPPTVATVHL